MTYTSHRGFTLIELAVVVLILLIAITVVLPPLGRLGPAAKASFCANNLAAFMLATHLYTQEYKYFPPHNPLPGYWGDDHPLAGLQGSGFDPSFGWLMTYAMRMSPPDRFANGHFRWFVLSEDELPDILVCPAAKREVMFEANPELDSTAPLEAYVCQYAAFYQVNGMIRSGTPVQKAAQADEPGIGGCNPPVLDLANLAKARQARNAAGMMPCVRIAQTAPSVGTAEPGTAGEYWIQAEQPDQVDNPSRVYYIADSREYRPSPLGQPDSELPGTTNNGWLSTRNGKVVLGARHKGLWGTKDKGVANVGYLDGHIRRDDCVNDLQWNMKYNPKTGIASSDDWRACTFSDTAAIPGLGNQHHLLPVLPQP